MKTITTNPNQSLVFVAFCQPLSSGVLFPVVAMPQRIQPHNAATAAAESGLVKSLGLLDASMIVAGSMIGSGIFIVSAGIARQVGSPALLLIVWLVSGLMTTVAALCYGELAAALPLAGGEYIFLRESLGPMWGFLYGWATLLVIQTATIAAVAIAFAHDCSNQSQRPISRSFPSMIRASSMRKCVSLRA